MSERRQFTTFRLAGDFFGVRVSAVQEILGRQEITLAPLAPATIGGLINVRGQIITAIDLRSRLGMGGREAGSAPVNVVVRSGTGLVSLLVDEIGDVLEVADESFEPPPETLSLKARELVLGVYKLSDSLMHVLDLERVTSEESAQPQF